MPLYKMGYTSYEESDFTTLLHESYFSQEEFEDMIIACTKPAISEWARDQHSRNLEDGYEYNFPEYYTSGEGRLTFQDLFGYVANQLCQTYGFERAKYAARYSVFGWANLLEDGSWDSSTDAERYPILSAKAQEVFQEVLKEEYSPEK